jgi:hypothetical protein
MQIFDVVSQGTSWLVLVINCVALYAVMVWPRIKGKAWFLAFLISMVLAQACFRAFDIAVRYSADEPRYELYETFAMFHILIMLYVVVAHVFLVIGLFHLRSFLRAADTNWAPVSAQHAFVPSMYCLACVYPLDRLQCNQCPECGRSFDPSDPSTYAKHPYVQHPRKRPWIATLLVWSPSIVLAGIHSLLWGLLALLVVISDDPEAGMVFFYLRHIDFFIWEYALSHPNGDMLLFWLGGLQWAALGLPVVLLIMGIRALNGRAGNHGHVAKRA